MTRWTPRPDGGRPSGTACSHTWTADPAPLSATCPACAARGRAPGDLLLCLTCGHVGCSDSSPGAHATAHFEADGHPVVRSLARDGGWAWCYEDEVYLDQLGGPAPPAAPRAPESVWDYPRPPATSPDDRVVVVECAGQVVAESRRTIRVLETSHPPVFYVPPQDVRTELLRPAAGGRTWCEWKGAARYYDVVVGEEVRARAAWTYFHPEPAYADLTAFFAFYPSRVDRCTVAGEVVTAQEGDFYGGWITSEVRGPFKGAPGTRLW
ncbi:DUF427 domain-containing protein [Streptomyces longwoodensis]|uniref:DUF427 domain-containing protein n=1 Tax=Streptomyces longwoodensis TaxID=68231 RepID=UPI000A8886FC|nr:DUF427 domain-containing protein [Streptomyces longwoodensis]